MNGEDQLMEQPDPVGGVMKGMHAQQKYQEMLGDGQTGFAEFMLDDDSIPTNLKKYFAVFYHKENALANITTQAQVDRLQLELNDAINDSYLFTPAYEQTAELERAFTSLRYKHFLKLTRAMGRKERERYLYQMIVSRDEKEQERMSKKGVFGKLRGLFK